MLARESRVCRKIDLIVLNENPSCDFSATQSKLLGNRLQKYVQYRHPASKYKPLLRSDDDESLKIVQVAGQRRWSNLACDTA